MGGPSSRYCAVSDRSRGRCRRHAVAACSRSHPTFRATGIMSPGQSAAIPSRADPNGAIDEKRKSTQATGTEVGSEIAGSRLYGTVDADRRTPRPRPDPYSALGGAAAYSGRARSTSTRRTPTSVRATIWEFVGASRRTPRRCSISRRGCRKRDQPSASVRLRSHQFVPACSRMCSGRHLDNHPRTVRNALVFDRRALPADDHRAAAVARWRALGIHMPVDAWQPVARDVARAAPEQTCGSSIPVEHRDAGSISFARSSAGFTAIVMTVDTQVAGARPERCPTGARSRRHCP